MGLCIYCIFMHVDICVGLCKRHVPVNYTPIYKTAVCVWLSILGRTDIQFQMETSSTFSDLLVNENWKDLMGVCRTQMQYHQYTGIAYTDCSLRIGSNTV